MDQNNFQQQPPQQPPYQQPYQPQPEIPGTKGKAIAGLVLGIISVFFWWAGWFALAALVLGIVGIILSIQSRKAIPAGYAGRGIATAGLVLSIIGTVCSGIGFISCVICAGVLASAGAAAGLSDPTFWA